MIGIVAVSHSARLAEAAIELAMQMTASDSAQVRVAAGAGHDADGTPILGTDAVEVASAIDDLAEDCDGVVILMDLGSAIMSAELALELRTSDIPVSLIAAPFVEGLLAAVVTAASGGDMAAVSAEATNALQSKGAQLGDQEIPPVATEISEPPGSEQQADVTRTVRVRNRLGIHARPAVQIAEASAGGDVRLRLLPDGPVADASSLSNLLVLGARQGDEVELSGMGNAASAIINRIADLFEEGFGEDLEEAPIEEKTPAEPTPEVSTARPPVQPKQDGEWHGHGVSRGAAVGIVVHLASPIQEPSAGDVIEQSSRAHEAARIEAAAVAVGEKLSERSAHASGAARDILDASRLIAMDGKLIADASARVEATGCSAARAVWEAFAASSDNLAALGGRAAERVVDLLDARDRIIAEILGVDMPGIPERDEPFVLVATDLAPADTATLSETTCVALVTEQGGPTSHTAILARTLGLPAVVGAVGIVEIPAETVLLVDGDRGIVTCDPSETQITATRNRSAAPRFDGTGKLADGTAVPLLANVGRGVDAATAAEAGAEGIGLFRTEFCFLDQAEAPDLEAQVRSYRQVLAAFPDRKVIVRTLDAGSDKPLRFLNTGPEENPALGVRGLRTSRRAPALLDDQLRALAIAQGAESAHVEVMAPMVSTVTEAQDFTARARAAGLTRVGIMIETPAAALMATEMFEVVDFVSIGTNDLTQYVLAADRLLGELGDLNDPWQPSALRLISTVSEAGKLAGCPVGVCGEAAGDPLLAPVLVGLGVTSLSMSAHALDGVASALKDLTQADCVRAAQAALRSPTAQEARASASQILVGDRA